MKKRICLVNELGEIIGYENHEVVHDPNFPKMHLSVAVLVILEPGDKIGLKKMNMNEEYPMLYDFAYHDHVYESELIDEKIKNVIKNFCEKCRAEISDYIYFYQYKKINAEYEFCKVISIFSQKEIKKETLHYISLKNLKNRDLFTPRVYGFIKYHLPHIINRLG